MHAWFLKIIKSIFSGTLMGLVGFGNVGGFFAPLAISQFFTEVRYLLFFLITDQILVLVE